MTRWFVTGASGFIGRALCRVLLGAGHSVIAMVRSGDGADLRQAGAQIVKASLADEEAYEPLLAGCQYVVHLAGDARFGNGPGYEAANVAGTATLLAAVQRAAPRVRRFVFVSSIGAVDRAPGDRCETPLTERSHPFPSSDYGRSKLQAERLVERSGLEYAIVRPALVVGPEMRWKSHVAVFARSALQCRALSWFNWPGQVSIIHVEDLVRGLLLAATAENARNRIFFAAGEAVAIGDLFTWAAPARFRVRVRWAASMLRWVPWLVPFNLKVLLYPGLTADDSALRQLGWEPELNGERVVAEVIDRERRRALPSLPPAGKTVVTGAASGLGRALAEELATTGRELILVDCDRVGLDTLLPGRPHVERVDCDLADHRAVEALLRSDAWARESIDELFACAGFGLRGKFAALPVDRQADLFNVNVLARLEMTHHVLQGMLRRQFGRIIWISSSSAFQPLPYMAAYAASNVGLLHLGEALAAEVKDDGVCVLIACPGGMQTGFQQRAGVKQRSGERLADPRDVAQAILGAVASGSVVIMPSSRSKGMAMAARVLPRGLTLRLWTRLMSDLR